MKAPSPGSFIEPRVPAKTRVKSFSGELWSSAQRKGCAIHEISYRACFKPQVPRFFIDRYTKPADIVYDPFMGRGTSIIEAILSGRKAIGNDVNPLSRMLAEPRLDLPAIESVGERLEEIDFSKVLKADIDLSMFYHHRTLRELLALRKYLGDREKMDEGDKIDRWIRMIATNRLTGHSSGFFSVYTLPPNQAASQGDQVRINRKREQKPDYRNVPELILRKTKRMLSALDDDQREKLSVALDQVMLLTGDARSTPEIMSNTVQLTVTSPPFLDIVDYAKDNWLRCWFNGISLASVERKLTRTRTVSEWAAVMQNVFRELYRITKPGGHVAFEVGEVRKNTIKLDDVIVPVGESAGFNPVKVFINAQRFTKTAHIWGVRNNTNGTNTNRIVLFQKTL
jgi:hypothetical protein